MQEKIIELFLAKSLWIYIVKIEGNCIIITRRCETLIGPKSEEMEILSNFIEYLTQAFDKDIFKNI